jgi:MYXO-CTERM domain-containing protein
VALAGGLDSFAATGPLEIVFSPPVNEVSVRAFDLDGDDRLQVTVRDAQGNVLNTTRPSRDSDGISNYAYTSPRASAAPVTRIQFQYDSGFLDGWYIDALRFNAWRCGDTEVEPGEACDDGNARVCDGCNNSCQSSLNGCLASGSCIANGASAPGSFGCATCDTSRAPAPGGDIAPVSKAAGQSCDDGAYCVVGEACNGAGACTGQARDCNDGAACTSDSCNESADRCDNDLTIGGCVIGAACVNPGTPNPANPCQACNPALSTTSYSDAQAGTACGNPSCVGGSLTTASLCDGAGTCVAGTTQQCPGGSNCRDATSCIGGCTSDNQCLVGNYCSAGTCQPKKDPGTSCDANNQCVSGICVDGVCCNVSCDGSCESCALPGKLGQCSPYSRGTDPELECGSGQFCSGQRSCVIDTKPPGTSCNDGSTCASGYCVDGVCCDTACDGSCEACNLEATPGLCSAIKAGTDPEAECGVGFLCSGKRSCTIDVRPNGEDCGDDTVCASGHCADGVCCDAACDRSCETCRAPGSVGSCTPYEAGTDPEVECGTARVCAAPGVCVDENRPNGASCEADAFCESGHCADGVCCDSACDGVCVSCVVKGSEGECKAFTAGTDPDNECSGDAVCDGLDRCVSFETRGNGLCAVEPGKTSRGPRNLALLGLALGVLLFRRRRKQA